MISTTRSVYGTRFKIPLIRSVGLEHLGGSELWMSDGLGLDTHDVQLVKIDVEGAESLVFAGMKNFLKATRPCVICEVLHAPDTTTLPAVTKRNDGMVALLREIGYSVFRLRKRDDRVCALEAILNFPEALWVLPSSPELCDYLFVPLEEADSLEAEFSPHHPMGA